MDPLEGFPRAISAGQGHGDDSIAHSWPWTDARVTESGGIDQVVERQAVDARKGKQKIEVRVASSRTRGATEC